MLEIVITHYREPWEVCKRQFRMLDAQRGVDWNEIRVTVVNDGGYRVQEDKLTDLDYRVEQLDIPHGGISAARNAGIMNATEPWIMFCDCDDCFSNVFALEGIMNVLHDPRAAERYDMLWTKVWAEDDTDGKHQAYMIQDKKIFVFTHGKIYRRQFLIDEGIRFDESLTFNEDSLFNATILTRRKNTQIGAIHSFAPEYVWINRGGSVTKGENAVDESAIMQFQRNMAIAAETLEHKPETYPGIVTRVIYDTYCMIRSSKYSPSCKRRILSEFVPWVADKTGLFGHVTSKELRDIRSISRSELMASGDVIKDDLDTVREWMLMQTGGAYEKEQA